MSSSKGSLERNLQLIPVHRVLTSAMVWVPIFVLFTNSRFGVDGAFVVAALYYLFVVALEVPSGWMSDRIGRVPTLRVVAVSWIGAHTCFLLGNDQMFVIVLGQLLLASGYAFLSGTDVSFHYDTLESLGRADEYATRQARVSSFGYVSAAVSALFGGVLGLVDLRLAFLSSLVLAFAQVGVAWALFEPPSPIRAEAFLKQIGSCLRYLKTRYLGWLFFYGTALVILEHVAFTPSQLWLTRALERSPDDLGNTPLLAGIVFAGVALVGSWAARLSAPAGRRFGPVKVLLTLAAVSATIVTAMALTFSVLVLVVFALRSIQGAAAPVLISSEVAPRTAQHHRATLLSLNSLAGRGAYGLLLLFVSNESSDDVKPVLQTLSVVSWLLVAVLIVAAIVARRPGWKQESVV